MPYLKPLAFLLKTVLDKFNLNCPYKGGMGSYVLILMISAFMKIRAPLPSAAHYFVDFLRYYGEEFQFSHMIIVGGEYIMIPKDTPRFDALVVIDPFTMNTNAASSVTEFVKIQTIFKNLYKTINGLWEQYVPEKSDPKILDAIFSV